MTTSQNKDTQTSSLQKTKDDAVPTQDAQQTSQDIIIVGVGASAGGLEALRAMLTNLPPVSNMAFVVVQHLDPTHRSMLTNLLARYTKLPVAELTDGQILEANHLYITPPGKDVTFAGGKLRLSQPKADIGPKPSIDRFFISLAEAKRDKVVGIILSGTGSDGAHGVRAIKAEGGITIVQTMESAKYDGMPRAAIETGLIDLTLPPDRIGPELVEVLKYPQVTPSLSPDAPPPDSLERIFSLLLHKTGCDFSDYKISTIRRRLERRMAVHKLDDLVAYVQYLEHSDTEIKLLFKDILISVTSFFRDPEAFEALRGIVRRIIREKASRDDFRIWVPGCATGEEAYSVAILLAEELGDRLHNFNIQIFATDIDVDAINRARRAAYPEAVVGDVDREILDRYFVRHDNIFQVTKSIREMVVFARQDLTKDPPFSRLDLISCRNVFIYFNASLQKKLFPMFHYILAAGGYLFLGKSESIGQFEDLFATIDKKWKIYQRRETMRAQAVQFASLRPSSYAHKQQSQRTAKRELRLRDVMNEAIATAYGLPGVLIDDRQDIVHVRGNVSPYLALSPGDVDLNILAMIRTELRVDLRALIHKSTREEIVVHSSKLKLVVDDQTRLVTLHVYPAQTTHNNVKLTLVLFEHKLLEAAQEAASEVVDREDEDPRLAELEHELAATREHLHTTIEELETANEELQSLNEELQSANEELQSSNEELETANEELQSTNEELTTVNEELQVKSSQLAVANTDLENILKRIGAALIIVDEDLRITRFTPVVSELFAMTANDIGQVLTTIAPRVDLPNLRQDLLSVVNEGKTIEKEVDTKRRIYQMQVFPYYSEHDRIAGAVLMFLDQTVVKRAQRKLQARNKALQASEARYRAIVEDNTELIFRARPGGKLTFANQTLCRHYGLEPDEVTGQSFQNFVSEEDWPLVRKAFDSLTPENPVSRVEHRTEKPDGTVAWQHWTNRAIFNPSGRLIEIQAVGRDVTGRKEAERDLQQSEQRLALALEISGAGIFDHAVPLEAATYHSRRWAQILGYDPDDLPPPAEFLDWIFEQVHPDDLAILEQAYTEFVEGESDDYHVVVRLKHSSGRWIYVESTAEAVERNKKGQATRVVGIMVDISQYKETELALQQAQDELEKRIAQRTEELVTLNGELQAEIEERIRAEAALKDREEQLELAIEGSNGGLWVLPLDPERPGTIPDAIDLSPQLKRIIGYEEDEFPNSVEAWYNRIVSEDLERVKQKAQDYLAGNVQSYETEYRIRHKDGSLRWIYSRGQLQRDADGRPVQWAGIDWDVTDRKREDKSEITDDALKDSPPDKDKRDE